MPWEKAWWEIHKDPECCFEQVLEAAPHKTAAVLLFTSYLTNHPNKMGNTYWTLLKNSCDVLLWTPTHEHNSLGRPIKTFIQQLCADTGYHPEDLQSVMIDWDWRQSIITNRPDVLSSNHGQGCLYFTSS